MASLCDVFLMDAFGTAHRAQASTHGVGLFAPEVAAGPLMAAELDALGKVISNPGRPAVAIVGGSKVSTKLACLQSLRTELIRSLSVVEWPVLAAAGFVSDNRSWSPISPRTRNY